MKKKLLAMLMISVLAVTAFTGCGNAADTGVSEQTQGKEQVESLEPADGTESVDSTEQVTGDGQSDSGKVTLKVWAEEDNFDILSKMIDSFKQEYAGQADFDITLEEQSDSGLRDVMLSDVHNAADVFSFPDDQLNVLVSAGALYPVTKADEVKKANLEGSVNAASYNDTLYAYPMTADNGYFMYYDKNYFSDEDVKTLDGMLAVAEASGKKISMEFNSGWYLYAFFGQTGLDFGLNEDGVTNHCNWNSTEGAIKGTDIADSLLRITSSPAFLNQGDGDFVASIKDGSVIAGINGVWNAMDVKEAWGDNYGAVKLPTYTCAGQQVQMASFTGYKMMGVNYYSKHREWACKLADWLTNEENQTIRFEERNQGPSNINVASSDAVGQVPAIAAVIDQSQYGILQRVGNSYWDASTEFANTILAGNPEGLVTQELMDTLVEGITKSVVE